MRCSEGAIRRGRAFLVVVIHLPAESTGVRSRFGRSSTRITSLPVLLLLSLLLHLTPSRSVTTTLSCLCTLTAPSSFGLSAHPSRPHSQARLPFPTRFARLTQWTASSELHRPGGYLAELTLLLSQVQESWLRCHRPVTDPRLRAIALSSLLLPCRICDYFDNLENLDVLPSVEPGDIGKQIASQSPLRRRSRRLAESAPILLFLSRRECAS